MNHVIICNDKYVINDALEKPKFGVSAYLWELLNHDSFSCSHFITYGRSRQQFLIRDRSLEQQAAFPLDEKGELRDYVESCLLGSYPQPILYHQSDFCLPALAGLGQQLVTHHGPFVDLLETLLGSAQTVKAFNGGRGKLDALRVMQRRGIDVLRRFENITCCELGGNQRDFLVSRGVPASRTRLIGFPFGRATQLLAREQPSSAAHPRRPNLVFSAARLDEFKGIERFLAVIRRLEARAFDCDIILAGGEKDEAATLAEMIYRGHPVWKARITTYPRLRRSELLRMYRELATDASLVCTSRFETFYVTGVEAAFFGLSVFFVAKMEEIGSSRFFPVDRFFTSSKDAADAIIAHHRSSRQGPLAERSNSQPFLLATFGEQLQSL